MFIKCTNKKNNKSYFSWPVRTCMWCGSEDWNTLRTLLLSEYWWNTVIGFPPQTVSIWSTTLFFFLFLRFRGVCAQQFPIKPSEVVSDSATAGFRQNATGSCLLICSFFSNRSLTIKSLIGGGPIDLSLNFIFNE